MTEKGKLQINPTAPRCRNAARVSPLSGRLVPTKYSSPADTQHLISAEEFQNRFIRSNPGNRYTDSDQVVEEPENAEVISPQTPSTAFTGISGTQRSETETSVGSSVHHDNEEHAPTGW